MRGIATNGRTLPRPIHPAQKAAHFFARALTTLALVPAVLLAGGPGTAGFDRQEASWVALRADSGRQGLLRMTGDAETGSVIFTGKRKGKTFREFWSGTGNKLSYEQSVSGDGGESWETLRTATLKPGS